MIKTYTVVLKIDRFEIYIFSTWRKDRVRSAWLHLLYHSI